MERRLLYDGWLKVYGESDGEQTREVVVSKDAVAALVQDRAGRLLLVEQYRPAPGLRTWEIPAGCLDKEGLTPEEILCEELAEECELQVKPEDLEFLFTCIPHIGHSASRLHLYRVQLGPTAWQEKEVGDAEVTRARWWTLPEIREAIGTGEQMDEKTILACYVTAAGTRPAGGARARFRLRDRGPGGLLASLGRSYVTVSDCGGDPGEDPGERRVWDSEAEARRSIRKKKPGRGF